METTFRELDQSFGLPKGSAFRAFKRLALTEGRDFRLLRAGPDSDEIEALRRAGRIYAASVNVVLLTPAATDRLRDALHKTHGGDHHIAHPLQGTDRPGSENR